MRNTTLLAKTIALPSGYRLRKLTQKDTEAFFALERYFFALYPITQRQWRHYLTRAHADCYGIFQEDTLTGYSIVEIHSGRKQAYLATLAVNADHAGQGLGRSLMALFLEIALQNSCFTAASHVQTTNLASLHLHENAGFERIHHVRDYYARGCHAYYLQKTLAL